MSAITVAVTRDLNQSPIESRSEMQQIAQQVLFSLSLMDKAWEPCFVGATAGNEVLNNE